jgi:hypothetical protein
MARFVLFIACLLVAGCAADVPPPLYPVTGVITQDKKTVAGGGLILIPESGEWGSAVVNASVNPDGTFTVQTSRVNGDRTNMSAGAPAGRYKIAYHPPGDGQKVGGEYHFPDVVTVEPKDNALVLILPNDFPVPPAKGKGGAPAPNPADAGKDD